MIIFGVFVLGVFVGRCLMLPAVPSTRKIVDVYHGNVHIIKSVDDGE